jgi:hypothetical protein
LPTPSRRWPFGMVSNVSLSNWPNDRWWVRTVKLSVLIQGTDEGVIVIAKWCFLYLWFDFHHPDK